MLWLLSFIDETAFICVQCNRLKLGWGERVLRGWLCSKKCSDAYWQEN